MAFQVSPGVNISEIDLSTVVPAVSTTAGAIAGPFRWGPVDERILVTSEVELARIFGKPKTNYNIETFFTAADFLAYSNQLYVARVSVGSSAGYQTGGGIPATVEYTGLNGTWTLDDQIYQVVVQDDGAGNDVYAIGGQQALSLTFREGVNYRFDVSDASNDGFELSFGTVDQGTEMSGVTRFGTPGTAGAYVNVEVFETTPAAFFYYDTVTAGMGSDGQTVAAGSGQEFTVEKTATEYNVTVTAGGQDFMVGDVIVIAGTDLGGATPTNDLTITVDTILDPDVNGVGSIVTFTEAGTIEPESVAALTTHFIAKYQGAAGNSLRVDVVDSNNYTTLESAKYFDNAPDSNRVHIAVIDTTGEFTGIAGSALEVYSDLSLIDGTQEVDGTNVFINDVINLQSNYISIPETNDATGTPSGENLLQNGDDGVGEGDDSLTSALTSDNTGYGLFASANDVDVSLILQGKAAGGTNDTTLGKHIIENIAEARKDCVAFISPPRTTTVNVNRDDMLNLTTSWVNSLSVDSSYGVMDSGYKYRYDKYNDKYVWTPMNGDVAGLCVRTDTQRDAWFSPAGYNRGFIKNVIKLAFNPNQAERDALYKLGVNPIMSQPGQGVLLFGDRTMTRKYSAFDRINVRRLFIVLEKAVANASKFTLFEFNDEFTRAQFVNLIEPFLRDVQGRRGIYDFKVVCDATNNTSEVVDRNEFVGDIYVKPARSINYVQLNFVAVRTGVEFEEIVGR